ncbi:hypothetical protein F511_40534 [Dorcoceras hygrometricum]|uniref:Uncharacterized protein n=1 Tax=Dorcoceras hygrometricum TaxID=472368 RepID=A0A2Z7DDH0_9LAMI|nr:hypothetical protein F511_40534 [Dorcoceras hygrometricum]
MDLEFRLLSDILAKSVTIKAGSLMPLPMKELGESKDFSTLKILTPKTVGRYIAINDKIDVEDVEDVSRVKKTPAKRAVSKKRPAVAAVAEPVVNNKRTSKGKSYPSKDNMEIVPVAQESVPLQTIVPTPAAPAKQPPVPKRKSKNIRLRLQKDSCNDEIVEDRAAVEATVEVDVVAIGISTADDVDIIIEQVIAESAQLDTDFGSPVVQKADEMEKCFNLSYEEFVSREAEKLVETGSDSDGATETVACRKVVEKQPVQTSVETESRIDASAAYIVTEPADETEKDQGTDIADVAPATDEEKR